MQLPCFLNRFSMLEVMRSSQAVGKLTRPFSPSYPKMELSVNSLRNLWTQPSLTLCPSIARWFTGKIFCWMPMSRWALHFFHLSIPSYRHGITVPTTRNWLFLLVTELLSHPQSFIIWIVDMVVFLGMTANMIHHQQVVAVAMVDHGVHLSKHGKPYITMT